MNEVDASDANNEGSPPATFRGPRRAKRCNPFHADAMTVAQVAAIMLVGARTVVKWTDEKILPCRTLPLSDHRRFRLDDLLKFARVHGYTDEEVMSRVRVLAAGGSGGGG